MQTQGPAAGPNLGPWRPEGEVSKLPRRVEELQAQCAPDEFGQPVIDPAHGLKAPQR